MSAPLLEAEGLVKHFPVRAGAFGGRDHRMVRAVDGVSFAVERGETLALVGESGSGKSTTARLVLGLVEPTGGSVRVEGHDLASMGRTERKALRRRVQVVFQNPYGALSPRRRVLDQLTEPLVLHGRRDGAVERAVELLEMVRLPESYTGRYPHELSGGERQRVGIARALALDPELVVLDEPVSALDVSIQAEVLDLLDRLRTERGLSYLLVAHDLAVVARRADRVAVMYLGRLVEVGETGPVFAAPAHPYTKALLSAVPEPDPRIARSRTRIRLRGEPPSPLDPPSGCRFRTRCWKAADLCAQEEPALVDRGQGHPVACHFPEAG